MELLIFWFFGGVAIIAAFICITRKSPVASALWLVQTMFALAAMYVLLDAQFIAAMQVLVYAGAIMVLFLFVIMLLNLGRRGSGDMVGNIGRGLTTLVGVLLIAELIVVRKVLPAADITIPDGLVEQLTVQEGAVGMISQPMFRGFMVPFEVTSILLLVAVVGAVVLAKRKI